MYSLVPSAPHIHGRLLGRYMHHVVHDSPSVSCFRAFVLSWEVIADHTMLFIILCAGFEILDIALPGVIGLSPDSTVDEFLRRGSEATTPSRLVPSHPTHPPIRRTEHGTRNPASGIDQTPYGRRFPPRPPRPAVHLDSIGVITASVDAVQSNSTGVGPTTARACSWAVAEWALARGTGTGR